MTAEVADPDGVQLAAIVRQLRAIRRASCWYDAWCMPQGERKTRVERARFRRQLVQINLLYLGTSVLVLCDLSYLSRFWTQFECWLALQQPTTGGLRRAVGVEKRETFVPIYNGTETAVKLLEEQWEGKSPLEAKAILAKPDVTVTNQSDKEMQLVKLEELDGLVKRLNKGTALVLGIARAVGPKPEGRSWRDSAERTDGQQDFEAAVEVRGGQL